MIHHLSELELFKHAVNWKTYLKSQIVLRGDVLEVGAGIGTNTKVFSKDNLKSWTCTEIDKKLFDKLKEPKILAYTKDLPSNSYDTVLYIDVLEHINDDSEELRQATRVLRQGGYLVVLSPAHNWLFSPFDKALGHYRRYNKKMYDNILPQGVEVVRMRYLDSVGILCSLANKWILKKATPTLKTILVWDKFLIPLSKIIDPILRYTVGKSVLMVARKFDKSRLYVIAK